MVFYLHFVLFCIKMFLDNVKSHIVFTLCTVLYLDVLGQCEKSDVLLRCCIYTLYCFVLRCSWTT